MRKLRKCEAGRLNTGVSKCPVDFGKIKGAILLPKGSKLPSDLTADSLKELCHEDADKRIFPVAPFVEYAKNGGEPQANANGYGGVQVTDLSARTDTFTLDRLYPELNASLLKAMNRKCAVYFFDNKNRIYGMDDKDGNLCGFPMATIYPTDVTYPTSSAAPSLTISFAYTDARKAMENFNYIELDFDVENAVTGLELVELVKTDTANAYKLVEKVGGYDLTSTYGTLIADNASSVLSNATAATYDEDADVLTLTLSAGAVPKLKSPKVLFAAGIEGIEQA